jgi:hypothetical protein
VFAGFLALIRDRIRSSLIIAAVIVTFVHFA